MSDKQTLICNLAAGPGAGKSTAAAGTFALLKQQGVLCELATEYAKDVVWDKSWDTFGDQLFMFAQQHRRIARLIGQVDVVVTDSPLLLSHHYAPDDWDLRHLVQSRYEAMDNLDIFINRMKDYEPVGRRQSRGSAISIDDSVRDVLEAHSTWWTCVTGNKHAPSRIVELIRGRRPELFKEES